MEQRLSMLCRALGLDYAILFFHTAKEGEFEEDRYQVYTYTDASLLEGQEFRGSGATIEDAVGEAIVNISPDKTQS